MSGECVPPREAAVTWQVAIPIGGGTLPAMVTVPADPLGVVVLVRGTGGARLGSRSRRVISSLVPARYVVVAPVLGPRPGPVSQPSRPAAGGGPCGGDLDRCVTRLIAVTDWVRQDSRTAGLPIGYFATSTGAALALVVAARLDGQVEAVVVRAGRPDLARSIVGCVTAATLLIVGGADPVGLGVNGDVEPLLRCPSALEIIPGASHRFVEPGAMDRLVVLAIDWFRRYLAPPGGARDAVDGPPGRPVTGSVVRGGRR